MTTTPVYLRGSFVDPSRIEATAIRGGEQRAGSSRSGAEQNEPRGSGRLHLLKLVVRRRVVPARP